MRNAALFNIGITLPKISCVCTFLIYHSFFAISVCKEFST